MTPAAIRGGTTAITDVSISVMADASVSAVAACLWPLSPVEWVMTLVVSRPVEATEVVRLALRGHVIRGFPFDHRATLQRESDPHRNIMDRRPNDYCASAIK